MKEAQIPFFVRFLEGQDYPQVDTDVKAGPAGGGTTPHSDQVVTMKWPSDGDDNPPSI
jgi:Serine endopeptidase inhibitors